MKAHYSDQEKANLELVKNMFEHVLNAIDADAAGRYIAADYIQHNQSVTSGIGPLKDLLRLIRRENPQSVHDVKRMMADDDMVMVHYHARRWPGDDGWVAVDIYRIENGKIAEHWNVVQDIKPDRVNPLKPY